MGEEGGILKIERNYPLHKLKQLKWNPVTVDTVESLVLEIGGK